VQLLRVFAVIFHLDGRAEARHPTPPVLTALDIIAVTSAVSSKC
jgi:hypothetical protein